MIQENWLPISGYKSKYEVSDLGRVRSLSRYRKSSHVSRSFVKGRILKTSRLSSGYVVVGLSSCSKVTQFYVHRLVVSTFIRKLKKKEEVNHKDFNKKNNKLDNLEIVTPKENSHHAMLDGRGAAGKCGETNLSAKLTNKKVLKIRKLHSQGISQRVIAKKYKVSFQSISLICLRKIWKHI